MQEKLISLCANYQCLAIKMFGDFVKMTLSRVIHCDSRVAKSEVKRPTPTPTFPNFRIRLLT